MTGLVRKATLLIVGGLLLAGIAAAGVPNAANSTIPNCITIYDGSSTGILAALCGDPALKITIRDEDTNVVPDIDITFDFVNCAPDGDVQECDVQPDPTIGDPGPVEGPGEVITYNSNASGELCAGIFGRGVVKTFGTRPVCCRVYAGGFLMATRAVCVTTHDNASTGGIGVPDGACDGLDLAVVVNDVLLGPPNARSDFNCSGATAGDGVDLATQVAAVFFWSSAQTCPLLP